jgi:hypothetical protein
MERGAIRALALNQGVGAETPAFKSARQVRAFTAAAQQ